MKSKFLFLGLLSASLILVGCKDDHQKETKDSSKEIGELTISSTHPKAGDSLKFNYKKTSGEAELYYTVANEVYAKNIQLDKESSEYNSSIVIPDSADLIAFNFMDKDKVDHNNHKGYVIELYDSNNNLKPGTKAAKAYLYYSFGSLLELKLPSIDTLVKWINKDIESHPQIENKWENFYVQLLSSSNKDKAKSYINNRIENYYHKKSDLTAEDYQQLIYYYSILKDEQKIAELKGEAQKKYPQGKIAQEAYYEKFNSVKSLEEREAIFKDFENKFTNKNSDDKLRDRMLYMLAMKAEEEGNWDKFTNFVGKISDPSMMARIYNSIAWDYAENDKNLEKAAKLSKKSIDILANEKNNKKYKPNYFTGKRYEEDLTRTSQMYADTYGVILHKQGKLEKALEYQKIAVGEGNDSEINERYIKFLAEAEKHKTIENAAGNFIAQGSASENVKEAFKKAYQQNHPDSSEDKVQKELDKLQAEADKKMMAELKNEMLDEKAPTFTLKDLEGNQVSLEKLKGKTVVLDFWATWCGPCKASFPGMKKAVEKYADNDKVDIFFINTFENGTMEERIEKSQKFITDHNYPFQVLMDTPVEKGAREYSVAKDYGIQGIPTKIIVGPNGNIKFKKVGYSGNNDAMLKEIEMMIEMSQE